MSLKDVSNEHKNLLKKEVRIREEETTTVDLALLDCWRLKEMKREGERERMKVQAQSKTSPSGFTIIG